MKLLFAPLQRLANLMEIQTAESTKLQSVLTVSIADASKIQVTELQKQTTLLEDIRGLLRIQSLSAKKEKPSGGATKGKMHYSVHEHACTMSKTIHRVAVHRNHQL